MYRYRYARVNADSMLAVLARARIRVAEAWLANEDLCMDPIFTVLVTNGSKERRRRTTSGPARAIRARTTRVRRYLPH